ncbi:MAG: ferritin-like domain-containing protein [Phycisphaeraceae bacterium]|nr:ferritin-like domain-containing protein [Phycisphaeraceae bacterium]
MSNQALIEKLNAQLNREISTFLRYMLQGAKIRGAQWEAVRDMYLSEVADEVGHAQYLANQIEILGGSPTLDPDLAAPPSDVREMLQRDIEQEGADVRNYTELAELAGSQGRMALKLKMEEQAGDEDEHRQEMGRLLGR